MRTGLETPERTHYMLRGLIRGFESFNQVRIARTVRVSSGVPSTSYPCAGGVQYNLIWAKSEDIKGDWCEPRGHATHNEERDLIPESQKKGLIGVWHNGNLSQGTNTIGRGRMTQRSQLIFDKWDSVRSRTEECKNHSHTNWKVQNQFHQKAAEIRVTWV